MTTMDKIKYKIPERKITNVRLTQNILPHSKGLCFVIIIKISIIGMAKIANFFQALNILSEKKTTNNNEAEIKRGINIKKTYFSLYKKSKQE